jgi:hypothetical protein
MYTILKVEIWKQSEIPKPFPGWQLPVLEMDARVLTNPSISLDCSERKRGLRPDPSSG